jgi:hypothetical protein
MWVKPQLNIVRESISPYATVNAPLRYNEKTIVMLTGGSISPYATVNAPLRYNEKTIVMLTGGSISPYATLPPTKSHGLLMHGRIALTINAGSVRWFASLTMTLFFFSDIFVGFVV